ncbi:DUF4358 domain-containing protein [Clostridium aestuarii]|uniref:DUF4358 domain-containing protein n=1 Tax=Clostridium aestuarii TaxID=338193 RepID=A0ABT4D0U9_9CLOT|nr:DUF4358 domain-containing protein [Clostridium aestuarii]MCY6484862.1 DUF4358 domain-containing protein [Clostridium aestuarii]
MKKILSLIMVILSIFLVVGCGQKVPDVQVKDIVGGIKSQIAEDMKAAGAPEDMFKDGKLGMYMETDLTAEETKPIAELFNEEDIEQSSILQVMINVNSDLIIVLKAKDESKVESLKASLEKVKEQQDNVWSQYLPDQYEKVKNNIIKSKGKYVIYITYSNPESIEAVFDNALK